MFKGLQFFCRSFFVQNPETVDKHVTEAIVMQALDISFIEER
jgi:hypothetical protein